VTESSASFAVRAVLTGNASDRLVATNLLNFGHLHSGYHQPWALGAGQPDPYTAIHTKATRPWVVSGDAFGIKSWTTMDHSYQEYFSDDDARGLLGAVATAGLLKSERWHSTIATGVLGNLRQTHRGGFAPGSAGFAGMVDGSGGFDPAKGWRKVYDSAGGVRYSPHYEAYIWAVYLWGYSVTGFAPLLERAAAGLGTMMAGYPSKWVGTANGIAPQRARILLPLAFLVRANDTALHRRWLQTAVDGFMTRRHCEGDWCAYREELSHPGWGGATGVPGSNAAYGTGEAPLNQENEDPVSDFLYTSNFALLGLHEAAAATGNATVKAEADRLANFVVRLQARSTERPELDGAFMRAFDYEKWEAWASDADVGWGAWSVESGPNRGSPSRSACASSTPRSGTSGPRWRRRSRPTLPPGFPSCSRRARRRRRRPRRCRAWRPAATGRCTSRCRRPTTRSAPPPPAARSRTPSSRANCAARRTRRRSSGGPRTRWTRAAASRRASAAGPSRQPRAG
jgi:hypothetical protein